MSHHLDSPQARQDVRLDITDVYLFRGTHGTVFVINVNSSVSGPEVPQGFHHEGLYEFNIDTNGDAIADITYRVSFSERDGGGVQALGLSRFDGAGARDRFASGTLIAQGHTGIDLTADSGERIWAGLAGEPFYIEQTVVGAVSKALDGGSAVDLTDWDRSAPANLFAGTNVNAIVLEVPDSVLGARHIGFWGTTALATDAGGWYQTNRAALPLVPLFLFPNSDEPANAYNNAQPIDDRASYAPLLSQRVAQVVATAGTVDDPEAYGRAVADMCFPDVLPYEVGTVAMYGFARRNGRSLTDNAPEVMFSFVTNSALSDGLNKSHASG
ncbi:MAG: DUF4331 family protein, partial [Ktedonobacteraceae bacterium]|nr:DUF4331 family protein [Ktedonobacteraceae bacterium]